MGKYLFIVVLTSAVLCHLVTSQLQPRSISNSSRNQAGLGRAISSNGKRNKIPSGHDKVTGNDDIAFDNSPESMDSSEIRFPDPGEDLYPPVPENPSPQKLVPISESNTSTSKSHWKKIPLSAFVKFGSESNLASFFKNYVNNTKVMQDNNTKEEFLTDTAGNPILTGKSGEKVVLTKAQDASSSSLRFSAVLSPKARAGSPPPEARTRISVNHAVDKMAAQQNPSLTLPLCTPESTTVTVPLTVEPHLLIIPKCVKIERCGGCCLSDITVCEPEAVEMVEFPITTLGYIGDGNGGSPMLEFVNVTTVKIERHKTCRCKCRTKKDHCKSQYHQYVEGQCTCQCRNYKDYEKCINKSNNHLWDNDTCMCGCRESKECSSGYFFDLNTCDCQNLNI